MHRNNNIVQKHALHTNVHNEVQNIQMLQMIKTGKVAIPVKNGRALSHIHNTEEHNIKQKSNTDVEAMHRNNNIVQKHALHTNVHNIHMLQMIKTGKVAIPVKNGRALSHVHNTEE
jgi:hypothetical protein